MKAAVDWDVKSCIFVDSNNNDSEQPISPHYPVDTQHVPPKRL